MTLLKDAQINNGSVSYNNGRETVPATTKRDGNVTINHSEIPGIPPHFEVSFLISPEYQNKGVEWSNIFHWKCIVLEKEENQSYRSVEMAGAEQVVAMLRDLASHLEKQIDTFNTEKAEKDNAKNLS